MRYTKDGELEPIEDDEEYDEVEEVFNAWQEDPKIQQLKEDKYPSFGPHAMLPYRHGQITALPRAFGVCLIPDYYPRTDPRPVSCYALFE